MSLNALIPMIFGIAGLFVAWKVYNMILQQPAGEGKVVEISDQIHKGAMVFMRTEYSYLAVFVGVVAFLLLISDLGFPTMFSFLVGAACSATAGYIGMFSATHANVRTTTAAKDSGASGALTVAFYGGSVMGLTVAAMGLLGVGLLYLIFGGDPHSAHVIHGF